MIDLERELFVLKLDTIIEFYRPDHIIETRIILSLYFKGLIKVAIFAEYSNEDGVIDTFLDYQNFYM